MKQSRIAMSMLGIIASVLCSFSAQASNSNVETALQNRPELSQFREALNKTGVINELKQDERYTLFAPTNAAFAQLVPNDAACYQSQACKAKVAAIVRDHIVPMKKYVDAMYDQGGEIKTIGTTQLHVAKNGQRRDRYTVDGQSVASDSESDSKGVLIYALGGVIASDTELAALHGIEEGPAVAKGPTPEGTPANAAMAPMKPVMAPRGAH